MVNELFEEQQPTGLGSAYETPSTVQRLQNPIEISGQGMDTAKQMGDTIKSTNSISDNMFSGYVTQNEAYGMQLGMGKEFERQSLRREPLDEKTWGLYAHFKTQIGRMVLNKLQMSNSVEGRYSTNMVEVFTNAARSIRGGFRSMFGGGNQGGDNQGNNGGLQ